MCTVSRAKVLEEKLSGNYKCPHFVPPSVAESIGASVGKKLDGEAAKALAEIAENFAAEIVLATPGNKPSSHELRDSVRVVDWK